MSHIESVLWEEKYRPKTIEDLILPKRLYEKVKSGTYQHFLFYGPPGTGKTSTAKILANGHAVKYINCSRETSVENVRTQIRDFASTLSIMNDAKSLKVIILDEIDGVSDQYMKALKGTIEEFHATTRFIATSNHINKIDDAILSRMECLNFSYSQDEEKEVLKQYLRRVYDICKNEGISIEKDALLELVKRKFPDLRNIIKVLQGYHAEKVTSITLEHVKTFHGVFKDIYEMIFSSNTEVENYKVLGAYHSNTDDVISSLGVDFIEYIILEKPDYSTKIGEIAMVVNEHSSMRSIVIDKFINLLALVARIQQIIRK